MKTTKRRLEPYNLLNQAKICAHLEQMAQKGWLLEKITNFGWRYRKIAPKPLRFAVTYYPYASEFDPEPPEDQLQFYDFCAHTGWKLACAAAQMQIFYNEAPDPVPIQTEPELELQALHASAKRSLLPSYWLLLGVAMLQLIMFTVDLVREPVASLSSADVLYRGAVFLLLAIQCGGELAVYFCWLRKARKAADQGIFLSPVSTTGFQWTILALALAFLAWWVTDQLLDQSGVSRLVVLASLVYMPLVILLVNGPKVLLKRLKVSREVNRTVSVVASFLLTVLALGGFSAGIIRLNNQGTFVPQDQETYDFVGRTMILYQDELPLTIEDLMDTDYDGYVRQRQVEETFLVRQTILSQYARYDDEDHWDIPSFRYVITEPQSPGLYDWCKKGLLKTAGWTRNQDRHYIPADASPWGVEEVYKLYGKYEGGMPSYLVCYPDHLVEIRFDWTPTREQLQIAGEKLRTP